MSEDLYRQAPDDWEAARARAEAARDDAALLRYRALEVGLCRAT